MSCPPKKIDWKVVDQYLRAQCEGTGIAGILGIHPETLYRRCEAENGVGFSEYSSQKKGEGKELLRAKQFNTAMSGDKTLLIWLGKQYLDQREKQHDEFENTDNVQPVQIIIERKSGRKNNDTDE